MTTLFEHAEAERRKRERQLEQRIAELELALANLLAASRGVWHVQARMAKKNAVKLIKRAA